MYQKVTEYFRFICFLPRNVIANQNMYYPKKLNHPRAFCRASCGELDLVVTMTDRLASVRPDSLVGAITSASIIMEYIHTFVHLLETECRWQELSPYLKRSYLVEADQCISFTSYDTKNDDCTQSKFVETDKQRHCCYYL